MPLWQVSDQTVLRRYALRNQVPRSVVVGVQRAAPTAEPSGGGERLKDRCPRSGGMVSALRRAQRLGGPQEFPILPNPSPGAGENRVSYADLTLAGDGGHVRRGRRNPDKSIDGRGELHLETTRPSETHPCLGAGARGLRPERRSRDPAHRILRSSNSAAARSTGSITQPAIPCSATSRQSPPSEPKRSISITARTRRVRDAGVHFSWRAVPLV